MLTKKRKNKLYFPEETERTDIFGDTTVTVKMKSIEFEEATNSDKERYSFIRRQAQMLGLAKKQSEALTSTKIIAQPNRKLIESKDDTD